ncbi:MAG: hypothetical protein ABIQ72_10000 [Usitatibacter sp.]
MSRTRALVLAATLCIPVVALAATPPNACELVKPDEINLVSKKKVERVQQQKSGNPSECGFLESSRSSVLTVNVREVQYAVKDELFQEMSNLEKIYKSRAKPVEAVGEGAYWLPANHQLSFRKAKTIVTVRFSVPKNQNEADTAQIARVIESRLGK